MGETLIIIDFIEKEGDMSHTETMIEVSFGRNYYGKSIIITIDGVVLVKYFKHNLLNISELCDKG